MDRRAFLLSAVATPLAALPIPAAYQFKVLPGVHYDGTHDPNFVQVVCTGPDGLRAATHVRPYPVPGKEDFTVEDAMRVTRSQCDGTYPKWRKAGDTRTLGY